MEVQSESIEVYSSAEGYGGRNENVYEEMDWYNLKCYGDMGLVNRFGGTSTIECFTVLKPDIRMNFVFTIAQIESL